MPQRQKNEGRALTALASQTALKLGQPRSKSTHFFLLQVGAIPANALDDGQWSQGLISAVSV